jgi:hypothetical protein
VVEWTTQGRSATHDTANCVKEELSGSGG